MQLLLFLWFLTWVQVDYFPKLNLCVINIWLITKSKSKGRLTLSEAFFASNEGRAVSGSSVWLCKIFNTLLTLWNPCLYPTNLFWYFPIQHNITSSLFTRIFGIRVHWMHIFTLCISFIWLWKYNQGCSHWVEKEASLLIPDTCQKEVSPTHP